MIIYTLLDVRGIIDPDGSVVLEAGEYGSDELAILAMEENWPDSEWALYRHQDEQVLIAWNKMDECWRLDGGI